MGRWKEVDDMDRDEQLILNAFSKITVEPRNIVVPTKGTRKIMKKRLSFASAIAAVLILVSATAYATTGGLEGFLARFNPNFGEFAIAPVVPAYDIYDGVKVEVVGARQIRNVVLLYYTVEDITGQNRLHDKISLDTEVRFGDEYLGGATFSRRLHFNEEANRLYFERIMTLDELHIPALNVVELVANTIMDLSNPLGTGQIVPLLEGAWDLPIHVDYTEEYTMALQNVQFGEFILEDVIITPFGVQVKSEIEGVNWAEINPSFNINLDMEGRLFDVRLRSGGGGIGQDFLSMTRWGNEPIDVSSIKGITIDGIQIEMGLSQ